MHLRMEFDSGVGPTCFVYMFVIICILRLFEQIKPNLKTINLSNMVVHQTEYQFLLFISLLHLPPLLEPHKTYHLGLWVPWKSRSYNCSFVQYNVVIKCSCKNERKWAGQRLCYASAMEHLGIGMSVCLFRHDFQKTSKALIGWAASTLYILYTASEAASRSLLCFCHGASRDRYVGWFRHKFQKILGDVI